MSRIVPNIELHGNAGQSGSSEWIGGVPIVTGTRRGVLTPAGSSSQPAALSNIQLGGAGGTVGFYGTAPAAQTASAAAMQSSLLSTVVATSASFGATQLAMMSALQAAVQEVQNVLYAVGIYATH